MANFWQHISAFFDPHVAVNKDGDLVNANGLFDSGTDSTDYYERSLNPDTFLENIYNHESGYSNFDDNVIEDTYIEPSDTAFSDVPYGSELYQKILDAVQTQNSMAQSSADRAMDFEAEQARLNREFQAEQAQKAMDYQTEMSNTAYQRAMADLKAAGINPKMVAQLGAASSPSGISASGAQASGSVANMSMANTSALAGLLETYITSASALDRQNNGFIQDLLSDLFYVGIKAIF